jgi:hypothetical protein
MLSGILRHLEAELSILRCLNLIRGVMSPINFFLAETLPLCLKKTFLTMKLWKLSVFAQIYQSSIFRNELSTPHHFMQIRQHSNILGQKS